MKQIVSLLCFLCILIVQGNATELGIVNGNEVTPHSKPYQVHLSVTYYGDVNYHCSGVLVSDRDVITIGRCIDRSDYITVYAGAHNISFQESTQVIIRALGYQIRDDYEWDFGHNVAIIKLSRPIAFNQYISPIPLNLSPRNLIGRTAQFSGWGGVNITQSSSPVLREASANFVNMSVCIAHEYEITDTDLCLSGINGATTCFTDAGGPVVVDGELVGISAPKQSLCRQWRVFAAVDLSKNAAWLRERLEPTAKIILN